MTLKDQIVSDFSDVFLNTEEFAETATLTLRDTSTPTATVVVTSSNASLIDEAQLDVTKQRQLVEVLIGKDPAAAIGGIADPNDIKKLTRADGRCYGFTGRVINEDSASWTLEFARDKTKQFGTQQGRQT